MGGGKGGGRVVGVGGGFGAGPSCSGVLFLSARLSLFLNALGTPSIPPLPLRPLQGLDQQPGIYSLEEFLRGAATALQVCAWASQPGQGGGMRACVPERGRCKTVCREGERAFSPPWCGRVRVHACACSKGSVQRCMGSRWVGGWPPGWRGSRACRRAREVCVSRAAATCTLLAPSAELCRRIALCHIACQPVLLPPMPAQPGLSVA